jgi:hypothetical protein
MINLEQSDSNIVRRLAEERGQVSKPAKPDLEICVWTPIKRYLIPPLISKFSPSY